MDCVICWDDFQDTAFSLSCGHLFHKECIDGLRRRRSGIILCPICRKAGSTDVSPTHMRQIFLTFSRRNEDTATPGDSNQLKKDLDEALLNKGIAERSMARSQADNAILIRQNTELTTIHNTQKREIDRLKENELQMRRARDDATDSAMRLASECDALAAKIAALEEQKDEMQKRIDKHSDFVSRTIESFKQMKEGEPSTTTAQTSVVSAQPRTSVNPFTGQRSASEAISIDLTSRHARNQQRALRFTTQPVPVKAVKVKLPAAPPRPKTRVLKTGSDILAKTGRVPQQTAVLECVAPEGRHDFNGSGSNQYVKRFKCRVPGCGVFVEEYTRR